MQCIFSSNPQTLLSFQYFPHVSRVWLKCTSWPRVGSLVSLVCHYLLGTVTPNFIQNLSFCLWYWQWKNSTFCNFNDTFPAYCSSLFFPSIKIYAKMLNKYINGFHTKITWAFYGLGPTLSQAEFFVFTWDDKSLLIFDQFVLIKRELQDRKTFCLQRRHTKSFWEQCCRA